MEEAEGDAAIDAAAEEDGHTKRLVRHGAGEVVVTEKRMATVATAGEQETRRLRRGRDA